ncbi:fatty acyl-CoA reductase 1-like [Galendromus occidentalis]|uniref:Fatty acyl-CoA reductase n=1 Tax=Galendromus occidentalis TaxID=34638 RepID=A0AAJ7SG14_9ACAR|nr:fatty acyl-CoA reductase 1-like [Galendromus occidentalis]
MTKIPEFFSGKNVFITGISGFVGKVLVEKLLRSCPEVKTIYVLVREKKGVNGQKRMENILNAKLFENLHTSDPECFAKVKVISGDLLNRRIIANDADLQVLRETVNVVIHSAASVRFSEPLRNSLEINVRATYEVLELAKTMPHLESFVHVSTAYSNCQMREVKEKIYKCEVDPVNMLSMSEWMTEELMEHITPKLLKDRPNTYTFTKALAENLVELYSECLPIAIVRPSIITGAAFEPSPGWVDNYNGPNGLLIALGTGALTTLYSKLDCTADLIPVDFVANTILAAAKHARDGFKIYNCTSGSQNPIKWRTFMEESVDFPHKYPTTSIIRYPEPRITSHKRLHQIRLFLQHYVPAQVIDAGLRLARRKPMASKLYQRLSMSMDLLEFFATNEWVFENSNTQKLFAGLHNDDKHEFNFDVRTIHWPSYVHTYCAGIRQFLLKGDAGNLEQARAHVRRLKIVKYAYDICGNLLLSWGIWKAGCALLPCADASGFC